VQKAVADQAATVSVPLAFTPGQFEQNRDFMLRFGDEVKQVVAADVMDTGWSRR
jgi:hypothetical protein